MSHCDLATFIRNPEFSTEREKMMEHWLCHKIYEACFARSIRPLIYTTEYDRGGFDLALGIETMIREFQLKVCAHRSKTRDWDISASLLSPRIDDLEAYCILAEGNAYAGRMGGVIMMEVSADSLHLTKVDLYYCDISVLAFRHLRGKREDRAASKLYQLFQRPLDLHRAAAKGQVKIPKSCFVKVPSVASLLTLAGFPLDQMLSFHHQMRGSIRPILSNRDHDLRQPGEHWFTKAQLEHEFQRILSIES
jgi:hypothetical protein